MSSIWRSRRVRSPRASVAADTSARSTPSGLMSSSCVIPERAAEVVAANSAASVINAGDGARTPTQAVLDDDADGSLPVSVADLRGLSIAVGISRTARARSNLCSGASLARQHWSARAFLPPGFAEAGWDVHHDLETGLRGTTCICSASNSERQHGQMYPSMGEYHRRYGLTKHRLERFAPDALVMHPGPVNRVGGNR